ncbi:MAG: DUF721 domain-containing protein [Fibrobacterota bacterium]
MNQRRRPPLYRVGDLLSGVMDHIRETALYSDQYDLSLLRDNWKNICGATVAGVSVPIYLKDGVLTVKVHNSLWKTELFYMKKDILERIHDYAEQVKVKNIIFT